MRTLSNSQRLRSRIMLVQPTLDEVTARFWSHPEIRSLYPKLLIALHPVMRAGVRLMESAGQLAAQRVDDPLGPMLAAYYRHHADEERGHDRWVVQDLERLGVDTSVLDRIPAPRSASLLGHQYFWVHEVHPVAFLGYIACIEGRPPTLAELDTVASTAGIPVEAMSMYVKHARIDPHHRDELDALLDALPLDDSHHALLGVSAMHTCQALRTFFTSLMSGR